MELGWDAERVKQAFLNPEANITCWAKLVQSNPEYTKNYFRWRVIHEMFMLTSEVLKEVSDGSENTRS